MLDIGWSEILLIAVVAIVVVGPKDLPRLLRTVGSTVGKARRMAGDFQSQFNAALREAEREVDLLDAKKQVEDLKNLNPLNQVKDALNPVKSIGDDIKRELSSPMPSPKPAETPTPAEPVKTGHAAGDHGTTESSSPTVVAKSDAAQSDAAKSAGAKKDAAKSVGAKSDAAKNDAAKSVGADAATPAPIPLVQPSPAKKPVPVKKRAAAAAVATTPSKEAPADTGGGEPR